MKFKVEDKVRITNNTSFNYSLSVGAEGVITSIPAKERGNYTLNFPVIGRQVSSDHDIELVEDMNQEIVGYELLKDLPGIPAGKAYTEENSEKDWFNSNGLSYYQRLPLSQVQDTTWFKPIYKAKEVVVKISKGREVCITDNRIDLLNKEGEHMNFNQFRTLTDRVLSSKLNTGISPYDFEVLTFRIGCQEFTKEDTKDISKAIQNLK